MMKYILTTFLFCNISNSFFAQTDSLSRNLKFGVTTRIGILTYYGALNNRVLAFNSVNNINYGFSLSVKKKKYSFNANYDIIKISHELNNRLEHENFEAIGNSLGFDFNYWFVSKNGFGCFIGSGLSYFNYSIKSDKIDKNGNYYNYWSDGTIRLNEEIKSNMFTSIEIKRDYVYETDLGIKNFISSPIRAGFMLRLPKDIQLSFASNFYFINGKQVDGLKNLKSESNYFLYNTFSITYYFHKNIKLTKSEKFLFNDLLNSDEDKDGVIDSEDKCFGTLIGIKIDKYGCALDDDDDGIPNYLDKELNSKKGKLIDVNGIGIESGTGEADYIIQDLNDEEIIE